MEVALVVWSAQADLAVAVQVARRDLHVARRFDDQEVRLRPGVELHAVGGAARHHDVVVRLERQRAEHRVQGAPALLDEQHLVGHGVAVQLRLPHGRPAAQHRDIGVGQDRNPAADWVARRFHRRGLDVVVPQRRLVHRVDINGADRLDLAHPRRRPQVVDDAVGAAEAVEGDDLFVVDALVLVAGPVGHLDVALARDLAESAIAGHGNLSSRGSASRG